MTSIELKTQTWLSGTEKGIRTRINTILNIANALERALVNVVDSMLQFEQPSLMDTSCSRKQKFLIYSSLCIKKGVNDSSKPTSRVD